MSAEINKPKDFHDHSVGHIKDMSQGGLRSYSEGIRDAFQYLMKNYHDVFTVGQGLWSPWYVGNSMTDLDKEFGKERVIDTPVSENACTGMAIGAALCGYKPIVIHPRVDFMILATDQLTNQAAKWSHMLGGQAHPSVTVRGIINRGGQQGAQHSQSLHSWFAQIPGLRVVMPATPQDARDLMIASVLSPDPVLYIDDRWCYDFKVEMTPIKEIDLRDVQPKILRKGKDITLVGSSFATLLCQQAAEELAKSGVDAEVIDLRVVNPLDLMSVVESVHRTGRLLVVDGGWRNCGLAGEVIAQMSETVSVGTWKSKPQRLTLPDAPAPTAKSLEDIYYVQAKDVVGKVAEMMMKGKAGGLNVETRV